MAIYSEFCEKRSVLFSTDVAARGLDFNKAVDWVVQVSFILLLVSCLGASLRALRCGVLEAKNLFLCSVSLLSCICRWIVLKM